MERAIVKPRTLKGFRDYLPEIMIPRERLMEQSRETFRSFGFIPIDTPSLEYLDILSGKGSDETDKQLYHFTDHGGRAVGLRFDLTVPLARFVAQHINNIKMPFKRYHLGTVWRGENTQAGRYREFVQCDFDTIGTDSVLSDIELILVINSLLTKIGVKRFSIRINSRQILSGLLDALGLACKTVPLLRCLDKLGKIGRQKTAEEMVSHASISAAQADAILSLSDFTGRPEVVLNELSNAIGGNRDAELGIDRLDQIITGSIAGGVPSDRLILDVSIARGLDYYTGVVVETILDDLPGLGSICSGGRYDNLTGVFTDQHLPGVGASLGLDRLIVALEKLGEISASTTTASVFIPFFDASRRNDYLRLAMILRTYGINVELYSESRKLSSQLRHADERGFGVAIILGEREWDAGCAQLKDLKRNTAITCRYSHQEPFEILHAVRSILDKPPNVAAYKA